ncbi:Synapse-associated protein 1 [Umbelopsis nana]
MNELSQTFQKRAKELPSSWNSLSHKLQHLPTDIAHLPQNFESEREQFVQSKSNAEKTARKGSEHVAAWVGFGEYEDILKTKILNLSMDRRNFLVDPPEGATYQFDLGIYGPVAAATLKADPNLAKMRFELVPKIIKEPAFWHNYFYRVMLVKQSVFDGDDSNRDDIYEGKVESEKKEDVLFSFNDDEEDQDVVTTHISIDPKTEVESTTTKADTTNKPQTAPEEMEDWEREMREAAGLF